MLSSVLLDKKPCMIWITVVEVSFSAGKEVWKMQAIKVRQQDGTLRKYKNAEFIPAFLMIPEVLLNRTFCYYTLG